MGKYGIQRTVQSYPELRYMQTENECGDGENTWFYARYVYSLCQHYFVNGVNAYIYFVMKHIAHFVPPVLCAWA